MKIFSIFRQDLGFIFERGSTGDNAALIWDESEDKFTLGTTTAVPSATGNIAVTAGTLVVGTLEASSIQGAMIKTIVSKNDTQLDNGGAGYQLASGDTLICSADLGASRKVFLPASPAQGDVVEVKLKGIGAAGRVLAIEKGHASQNIDGGDSIILESDFAAVTLVATSAGNSCAWRVF